MTTHRISTFLVERYLPSPSQAGLAASVARVVQACAESACDDNEVRYLHSTYLPAEDLCFCVFQAPSVAAVQAVNEAAEFTINRITDAVAMHPAPTDSLGRPVDTTASSTNR